MISNVCFNPLQESDNQILYKHTNAHKRTLISAGYKIISRISNVNSIYNTLYVSNTSYEFVDNLIATKVTDLE